MKWYEEVGDKIYPNNTDYTSQKKHVGKVIKAWYKKR
jgi:hypothetical protein